MYGRQHFNSKRLCCPSHFAVSGRNELAFYTVPEYNVWKEGHANGKGWNAKYYKVSGCLAWAYRFSVGVGGCVQRCNGRD